MRSGFFFLFLLAGLITAGCTDDTASGTGTTTLAVPVTMPVPADTPAPTPEPVEMAYLENLTCTIVYEKVQTYHCMGRIRIKSGAYDEVKVTARYPDNNTFDSGAVAMGGSNPVLKPFILFPDSQYQDQDPLFFVNLDKTRYPVVMNGTSGIAYLNPPPTPAATVLPSVMKDGIAAPATPRKPVIPKTTIPSPAGPVTTTLDWTPVLSSVDPAGRVAEQKTYFSIQGWDFRQDPPPKVYLRRQGSSCEYCGVQAVDVRVTNLTNLDCMFDLSGENYLPASYDLLVTNSELQNSYAILRNAVTITEPAPVPTGATTAGP